MTSYRYPQETLVFWFTILAVLAVILFTSAATFCLSGLFIVLMFVMAYWMNRSHHQSLISTALGVSSKSAPQLFSLVQRCAQRLRPGSLEVFVAPQEELNAYTFGINDPKILVVYAPLIQIMDEEELAFVLGHEMGHVQLGHTWLNTILGGMAGIPASYGAAALLTLTFRSWNRMCEYSADRAGMLACGKPEKAVSALLKLISGQRHLSPAQMEHLLRAVDREDDTLLGGLNELLSDHPMIIKRIEQIRSYARTAEYQNLIVKINTGI